MTTDRKGDGAPIPAAKVRPPPATGMCRDRLIRSVVEGQAGVRVVQGYAGTGKTTVLAHTARTWAGPVAWVTADSADRTGDRFVHALGRAVDLSGGAGTRSGTGVFAVIEALEVGTGPTLLVIDDAHELAGAPAVQAVDLLCRYRPSHVNLVLGCRHLRGFDHWHWPVEHRHDVEGDSLRFRFWEVETLFRNHYGVSLGIGELRAVTRLTDGWAVALHLFHVGTRNLSAAQRRRLLAGPRMTIRSLRDYLTEQVLSTVGTEERDLLRHIAVFDRARPDRCEALLERSGCGEQLRRLAEVGLLQPEADGVTYHLHELLRAHLLSELEDRLGRGAVAGLHRLAADVLEQEGEFAEAVRACGRGGDWDGVRRLLARNDNQVVPTGAWAASLPPRLRDTDPWVLRSIGRRQLGEGDLEGARMTWAAGLERFRDHGGNIPTERSLRVLDGWLAPDPGRQVMWTECLRAALAGRAVDAWPDEPAGALAEGLAHLAAGRMVAARPLLAQAAESLTDELGALAELATALVAAFGDRDPQQAAERAVARARENGAVALVGLAESVAAYAAGGHWELVSHAAAARERHDSLGEAVQLLVAGLAMVEAGAVGAAEAAPPLEQAAQRFEMAGLQVPAALAHSACLLAGVRAGTLSPGALRAGTAGARQAGPLPHALVLVAQSFVATDRDARDRAQDQASVLARRHGFDALLHRLVESSPSVAVTAPLEVRCLGGIGVFRGGIDCEPSRLRPRHQELLAILVAQPNTWLHRERLVGWLWPDTSTTKAIRNLQVAISAVRRVVEPEAVPGHPRVVVRNGERYRLVVDEGASDVCRLEEALRAARRAGDEPAAARWLEAAFAEWRGEPVPEVGPTDWAVELRRRLAQEVGGVAADVVRALRTTGNRTRAAALAARAVEVELWDDRLWRLAMDAATEAGSAVLAADLEQRYRALVGS